MINSKTLGSAAGVQYQGVIDKSEGTNLPSLANGVIVGRFKRGRMDKPFKVTASNYQALLGRDPSNPSYLAVEDAFKRGVSEVSVLRVGDLYFKNSDTPVIPLPEPEPSSVITEGETYKFRFQTQVEAKSGLYLYLRHENSSQWVLRDSTSGTVLADHTGFAATGVIVDLPVSATNQAEVTVTQTGNTEVSYELIGAIDKVSVEYYTVGYFWNVPSDPSEAHLTVDQYSTNIGAYAFSVGLADLTIPETLPNHITDASYMFYGCYLFNQNISDFDTSNIVNMEGMLSTCPSFNQDISAWNVSKVENMNYMLAAAEMFNQDLSSWCVPNITVKPTSFDNDVTEWTLPQPVWGTCPRGEDTIAA